MLVKKFDKEAKKLDSKARRAIIISIRGDLSLLYPREDVYCGLSETWLFFELCAFSKRNEFSAIPWLRDCVGELWRFAKIS